MSAKRTQYDWVDARVNAGQRAARWAREDRHQAWLRGEYIPCSSRRRAEKTWGLITERLGHECRPNVNVSNLYDDKLVGCWGKRPCVDNNSTSPSQHEPETYDEYIKIALRLFNGSLDSDVLEFGRLRHKRYARIKLHGIPGVLVAIRMFFDGATVADIERAANAENEK